MTATIKELQIQAKILGVKGFSKLSKSELQQVVGTARKAKTKRTIAVPTTLEEASKTLGSLSKGNARKMRRILRAKGRNDLAAAKREIEHA